MGCDIHLYKEKHVNGAWIAADEWVDDGDGRKEVPWRNRFTDRNYELFGALSKGVRTEHPFSFEPRGVPFNASPQYAAEQARYGSDGHSHSYLYLFELREFGNFLKTITIPISGMKSREGIADLKASIASGSPNWDLLYPYSAWTNAKDHEEFSVDVPASYYIGGEIDKIIASFDGIDGDNHRIVFYFDN